MELWIEGNHDAKELTAMVQQVNETEVSTEDRLSDHVQHYDRKEAVMENAEKRVSRLEKEKAETKAYWLIRNVPQYPMHQREK